MSGQHQAPPAGTICWNELMTKDVAAAKKFYSQLLGWTMNDKPMGPMVYTMLQAAGKDVGGMMALPPEAGPAPSHWLTYIAVDNCDATTEKATKLGGQVFVPPTDVPNVGRFSVIQDPTGAVFAVIKLG